LYTLLIDNANLALRTFSPGVHRSIARYGSVESRTRGDVNHRVVFMGIRKGHMNRFDNMVGVCHRRVFERKSKLRAIRSPTGEDATIGRKEECVQVATNDLDYSDAIETKHATRGLHN